MKSKCDPVYTFLRSEVEMIVIHCIYQCLFKVYFTSWQSCDALATIDVNNEVTSICRDA